MIERLIKAYKKWRLRHAHEKHAYWKAKREILSKPQEVSEFEKMMGTRSNWHQEQLATAAAKEARYMERVEILIREQ